MGETGRPVPEPVTVELNCGVRPLQVIHTDLGGYFTFSLGTGAQSNMDFSASNQSPMMLGNTRGALNGVFSQSLAGCELRVAVPGYHPLSYTLSQQSDMGRIEVGTLRLQRIAGVQGSAISVTSLMVPRKARKEFEKALKDQQKKHVASAKRHLQKALAQYDKYAAAWNELGRIYFASKEAGKARDAFQKAIAADPQYTPPYLSLAALEIQGQHYQNAIDTAGKLLHLDPSIAYASFIQAVGNYNLNRLDAAEKSALEAAKGPHQTLPQVHALLAEIFLRKQEYQKAAGHMRNYLQEAPHGQFADRMKKELGEIEKQTANGQLPAKPSPANP